MAWLFRERGVGQDLGLCLGEVPFQQKRGQGERAAQSSPTVPETFSMLRTPGRCEES